MNFIEAMAHLAAGKKIAQKHWNNNAHIYWDGDLKLLMHEGGNPIESLNRIDSGEWIIFISPPPVKEVYQWRFKSANNPKSNWHIDTELMSKEDVEIKNKSMKWETISGPFQVEM